LIAATKPSLLIDTGLLSRSMLNKSPFIEAFTTASLRYQPVISTSVFIEMQHWLLIQRGLQQPISRAEYDRHRKRLESYVVLNSDSVSQQALDVARRWPDTGVGDCYTLATALVFDVPVFTLNPKHFSRVKGVDLYRPDNYNDLLGSVRRIV
jgi:predicted nucleic acid-binding protein